MSNVLYYLVEYSQLYMSKDQELGDSPKVIKCQLERGRLAMGLSEAYVRVMEALKVRGPGFREVDGDGNGEFMTQEGKSNTFTDASD